MVRKGKKDEDDDEMELEGEINVLLECRPAPCFRYIPFK
jgi:hypothetical protein